MKLAIFQGPLTERLCTTCGEPVTSGLVDDDSGRHWHWAARCVTPEVQAAIDAWPQHGIKMATTSANASVDRLREPTVIMDADIKLGNQPLMLGNNDVLSGCVIRIPYGEKPYVVAPGAVARISSLHIIEYSVWPIDLIEPLTWEMPPLSYLVRADGTTSATGTEVEES